MSAIDRLIREFRAWQSAWQQVDTLIQRREAARAEDAPYAIRCWAGWTAWNARENIRLRRQGWRLESPVELDPEAGTTQALAQRVPWVERRSWLPGPVDIEAALSGLAVDPDSGKPTIEDELQADQTTTRHYGVSLPVSVSPFQIRDDELGGFRDLHAPRYSLGGLTSAGVDDVHVQLPPTGSPTLTLFPHASRVQAAKHGWADLPTWSSVLQARAAALPVAARPHPTDIAPFSLIHTHLQADQRVQAFQVILQHRVAIERDVAQLAKAISKLDADDDEDPMLPRLVTLRNQVMAEGQKLMELTDALAPPFDPSEAQDIWDELQAFTLPSFGQPWDPSGSQDPEDRGLNALVDREMSVRLAYPDGTLRMVRALDLALHRMWLAKAPWFAFRRTHVLRRVYRRALRPFNRALSQLVQTGGTVDGLQGWHLLEAAAAGTTRLQVVGPQGAARPRVEPGTLCVLGGARPTVATLIGWESEQTLRILPLRVDGTPEGPGVPGLLLAGTPLSVSPPPPSALQLRLGLDADAPHRSALAQEASTRWSQLMLLQGEVRGPDGPVESPYVPAGPQALSLGAEGVLPPHANRLVLLGAPALEDVGGGVLRPTIGIPGEVLLVRGQDPDDGWWQGAVVVARRELTTAEALDLPTPEADPECGCAPETPALLLQLAANALPVPLVHPVEVHRDFLGFDASSLAVGTLLPAAIDPATPVPQRGPPSDRKDVERGPELAVARAILDQWLEPT